MVNILVVGATGAQGAATVKHLLPLATNSPEDIRLFALTRNSSSSSAAELRNKGFHVIQGTLADQRGLKQLLLTNEIHRAFLLTTPFEKAGEEKQEVVDGKNFISAAVESGTVQHIVFASVGSANLNTGVPHFDSKNEIEKELKDTELSYTILRPVVYMDNYLKSGFARAALLGLFYSALKGASLQMVALDDIGYVAAQALVFPDQYNREEISLAGDSLTVPEVIQIYDKVLYGGKSGSTWKLWMPFFLTPFVLSRTYQAMFKFYREEGFSVDIPALKKRFPSMHSFEQFLSENHKKI